MPYDEPELLGVLDGDPEVVVSLEEFGVLGVAVGGSGVVGGEADGVRSLGRSPTRLEPLSVQAVARVATSASAERTKSALFMTYLPGYSTWGECATQVPTKDGWAQRGPHSRAAIA